MNKHDIWDGIYSWKLKAADRNLKTDRFDARLQVLENEEHMCISFSFSEKSITCLCLSDSDSRAPSIYHHSIV